MPAKQAHCKPIAFSKYFEMKSAELSLGQHDHSLCAFSATPTCQRIRAEF
ncbi:hypothetical protein ALQ60_102127 [Pseudomonas syringae pv. papulans]|nr:hypothetical protein ALO65_102247 [Pseudomonas syringae pv. papulans]RMS22947.1 hypothetical protein ALP69_102175 [Pseudomonas syringae pv. aceris]RMN45170.1 hypothetical protein ALQ60_102127 [Pseudomonas syringae pv. papulans]RMN73645.1 hypothetical protein ALQ56_102955 [Pseudomonas syringae pv. papulans]RMS62297.1 hypothetical protein ALP62_102643 [Pseudomonas syringae pv. aceris]